MPKRRKTRRKKRRSAAPRVQQPRILSRALTRLLAPNDGAEEVRLTLGEAVKRLWARCKSRGLQEGKNLRCDEPMTRLFGVPLLTMFEVPSALSQHMRGAGSSAASSSVARASSSSSSTATATSRDAPLLTLSPALTSLICGSADGGGGGNRQLTLTQSEAVRRVGMYIQRQKLRDASDKRKIHCDAALAEIVGKGSFTIFEAKQLISRHLTPVMQGASASAASSSRGGGEDAAGDGGEEDEEDGEDSGSSSGGEEEEDGDEESDSGDLDLGAGHLAAEGAAAAAPPPQQGSTELLSADAPLPRPGSSTEPSPASHGTPTDDTAGAPSSAAASLPGATAADAATDQAAVAAADEAAAVAAAEKKKGKKKRARPPPTEFLCPITQELMSDPVSTCDGHTYERAAIERWLSRHVTSPLTGAALPSKALVPNISLRKLIQERAEQGCGGMTSKAARPLGASSLES